MLGRILNGLRGLFGKGAAPVDPLYPHREQKKVEPAPRAPHVPSTLWTPTPGTGRARRFTPVVQRDWFDGSSAMGKRSGRLLRVPVILGDGSVTEVLRPMKWLQKQRWQRRPGPKVVRDDTQ